ncbi:class I SAM-dependent methyltransferase [Salinisphaera sp. T31B1]|uniref:class I SAM-dependent methyltransferase n=1 Tax=Salinisphaera sp. T31B1 TaxID=727963 RepID=UPI00333E874C
MGVYARYVLPHMLDCACGLAQVEAERARLVPLAHGRVLEVGIGTGRNLRHYDARRVNEIVGLDPATAMQPRAKSRLAGLGLDVSLLPVAAERIPAAANSFDTVVVTYSLCSIAEPLVALAEMRRVLKPDGTLLFCEHGLAREPHIARWQARLTPTWRRLAGGCHLDRDVPHLLAGAGFSLDWLDAGYIAGPKPLTHHYRGQAHGHG